MKGVKIPLLFVVMEIVIMAVLSIIGGIISKELTSNSAENAEAKLMDKQMENQEELNVNAFNRQSEFWHENQSPESLFNQYRSLGASETAAIQSILGLSPASPISVSSGSAHGGSVSNVFNNDTLSQLLSSLSDSIQNEHQNTNIDADTDLKKKDLEWKDRLNQSNIDWLSGKLKVEQDRLGLDRDIYNNVTLPFTKSQIDKNTAEIKEINQKVRNLTAEYANIVQQLKVLYAQERNINASTNLLIANQENVNADTERIKLENRAREITVLLSEAVGFDVTADWKTQTAQSAVMGVVRVANAIDGVSNNSDPSQNPENQYFFNSDSFVIDGKKVSVSDFNKAIDSSCNKMEHLLEYREKYHSALDRTHKFFDHHYSGEYGYRSHRNWIWNGVNNYVRKHSHFF